MLLEFRPEADIKEVECSSSIHDLLPDGLGTSDSEEGNKYTFMHAVILPMTRQVIQTRDSIIRPVHFYIADLKQCYHQVNQEIIALTPCYYYTDDFQSESRSFKANTKSQFMLIPDFSFKQQKVRSSKPFSIITEQNCHL